MNEQGAIQALLREKYLEGQSKNPRYSLRAFSRKAGVHFAALSAILNGKRNVSKKLAARIAERLALDPQQRAELLGLFPEPKSAVRKRVGEGLSTNGTPLGSRYLELNSRQFKIASEWEHFAVLSLLQCHDFQSSTEWISRRLGITEARAKQVIDRLLELELLQRDSTGRLTRSEQNFRTSDDVASLSLKKSHEQTLELARESLFRDSVEKRDFTAVTVAVNPKNLSTAKELIRKFQDELCDQLEAGRCTEVYRLSVQLFPLTVMNEGDPE
jgi:uncharacterized protein (TIGR02147 family)